MKKPVDLEDEDPKVINDYMNCVYFGPEGLKHYADDMNLIAEPDRVNKADVGFQQLIRV